MNQQTTAAEKFFGVDTEMKSLKAKVEQKDREIAKLKQELVESAVLSAGVSNEQLEQLKQ